MEDEKGKIKKQRKRIKALHGDSTASAKEVVEEREKNLLESPVNNPDVTWTGALRNITPGDFTKVHQNPCNKQGFLVGIGSGFGVGGLRWILGASPSKASNWAVGAFMVGALGAHEYCEYRRTVSRDTIRMATIKLKQERAERRAREAAERAAEQERMRIQALEDAKNAKAWYQLW